MARPAVNVAVRAARAAGAIILRYMNRVDSLKIEEKARMDFATSLPSCPGSTVLPLSFQVSRLSCRRDMWTYHRLCGNTVGVPQETPCRVRNWICYKARLT